VIDLVDTELVAKPAPKPHNALSVLDFGADPTGATDAAPAIEAAIEAAKGRGKTVFIPKGTYQVKRVAGCAICPGLRPR
jgi:polygalacturonase